MNALRLLTGGAHCVWRTTLDVVTILTSCVHVCNARMHSYNSRHDMAHVKRIPGMLLQVDHVPLCMVLGASAALVLRLQLACGTEPRTLWGLLQTDTLQVEPLLLA